MPGIVLISGSSNIPLAEKIAACLDTSLWDVSCGRFADGEINIHIRKSIRGRDVYIIQPTCRPVNDSVMELLLLTSTARRASCGRVTLVVPYYGYARQDRKTSSRVPISAADVATLISVMCPDRVISIDLHCGQIQGFFPPNIAVDNLEPYSAFLPIVRQLNLETMVVVSPDGGGVHRATRFAELCRKTTKVQDISIAVFSKTRKVANKICKMEFIGDVKNKPCVIYDDIVDTAGTLCEAARILKENGCTHVYAFVTHGLFNGPAVERIQSSCITRVYVTDTTTLTPNVQNCSKIEIISVAQLIAKAISNIHLKQSIKEIFAVPRQLSEVDENDAVYSD